jgi:ribosome-binding protein aMBF1 (putative translation factor)
MDCQDWNPVTVNAKPKKAAAVVQKNPGAAAARRLEEEDIPKLKKHLTQESRQAMVQKRIEKGWKQTDLDSQCSFPTHTVRDFENGKSVPTPTQLNILNRVLGLAMKFQTV